MLNRGIPAVLCVALLCSVGRESAAEQRHQTKYFDAVLGCLDTLINDCTDTYGLQHSPMFCSLVDLKTHRIPKKAPPLLREQRKADRAYPGGNLQHDLFTLLAMRHVSKLTGDAQYKKAADAYLRFFLSRCAAVGNGLFPCGEHAYWDFYKETCTYPTHEDLAFVPGEFWEMLWTLNPKSTEKHIRMLKMHFLEGEAWAWNRHAQILSEKRPTKAAPFPRHAGFYIYQWAFLYSKTGDARLLELAKRTAEANRDVDKANLSMLSLGLSLLRANRELLGAEAIAEFDTFGKSCLGPIIEATQGQPKQGRILIFVPAGQAPPSNGTCGFWDKIYEGSGGYGFVGAEKLALMCLSAHRLCGSRKHLEYAKDVGDRYLKLSPPKEEPITPGKYGGLIALGLDLYDLTGEEKYFSFARQNADRAVSELYSNGLFRAASGADYYEAANGAGPLLIELIRLHLLLTDNDYPLPHYYAET